MINDKYIDELNDIHKQPYLNYKNGLYNIGGYGSHQPALIHLLNTITKGNVMEFGMGDDSTPLMHLICEKQNRNLLSIDSDKAWFDKFTEYKSEKHKMFIFDVDKILKKEYDFFNKKYSIVFVDAAPQEIRQPFIELIKKNADYILAHDTEQKCYSYDFSSFKYVYHFDKVRKQTSLLSNIDEIDETLIKIFKRA